MIRQLRFALGRLARLLRQSDDLHLPDLPRHATRGLTVQKGESLTLQNMRVSLENVGVDDADPRRARRLMHVPPWASQFQSGATFQLREPLVPVRFDVDGCRVQVGPDRYTLDVALPRREAEPLTRGLEVAEKTLDLMSADLFLSGSIYEPLREHSTWRREDGRTLLRGVYTERMGTHMASNAVVVGVDGRPKPAPSIPARRWHASHAYFRRSQTSEDLHEAYRNLFLGVEALLSEIYPWRRGIGERAWLRRALKRACHEYGLDLGSFVEGSGNPYRRFVREQYEARRCALFHAKLSLSPITPRDLLSRGELAAATTRLSRFYVELARSFTGARFAGSAVSHYGLERMAAALEGSDMFVCVPYEYGPANGAVSSTTFVRRVLGEPSVHALEATWSAPNIPGTRITEVGALLRRSAEPVVGIRTDVLVDLSGVDELQLALQLEMVNVRNLREWVL